MLSNNTPQPAGAPVCRGWNESHGNMKIPLLPNGTLLALGSLSRMMMVVPSENMVVVAFGSGTGEIKCPNHTRTEFTWAQSIRIAAIWKLVHAAIAEHGDIAARRSRERAAGAGAGPGMGPGMGGGGVHPELLLLQPLPRDLPGAALPGGGGSDRTIDAVPKRPALMRTSSAATAAAVFAVEPRSSPRSAAAVGPGACYCYCGASQAIGNCFTAVNESACELAFNATSVTATIRDYCPNITYHYDCFDEPAPCRTSVAVTPIGAAGRSPRTHTPPHKPHHHPSRTAGMRYDPDWPWFKACPTPNVTAGFQALRDCHYYPVAYHSCIFVAGDSCKHSPFFPAGK